MAKTTHKQKLKTIHDFMTWKTNKLKEILKTKIQICTEADHKELDTFSKNAIHVVYLRFKLLPDLESVCDEDICPWCINYSDTCGNCPRCEWGKRNGFCCTNNSKYNQLIKKHGSIVKTLTIYAIKQKIKELINKGE
jgi:hypothetical protein